MNVKVFTRKGKEWVKTDGMEHATEKSKWDALILYFSKNPKKTTTAAHKFLKREFKRGVHESAIRAAKLEATQHNVINEFAAANQPPLQEKQTQEFMNEDISRIVKLMQESHVKSIKFEDSMVHVVMLKEVTTFMEIKESYSV